MYAPETATTPAGHDDCGCDRCRSADLPVNPFLALRVAYGMLLGEEDLRVLMGQPRGKVMMHNAWLHGSGVVWGLGVRRSGWHDLRVGPGLAVDGWGRELRHEASCDISLRPLLDQGPDSEGTDDQGCRTWTVEACLLAEFDCCLDAPVPTLSDPCDVTRKHDDYSRVQERTRIWLRPGCCPPRREPYPRVRMLFGLRDLDPDTDAGRDARQAREAVASSAEPTQEMVRQLRAMACRDSGGLGPDCVEGEDGTSVFPVPEDETAVVLGCVTVTVRERDGCPEIVDVRVDPCVRTTLLPTDTITDLLAGQAPGLIGSGAETADTGPRVIGSGIRLEQDGRRLIIPVTAALDPATVARSVGVTSFSPGQTGAGWVVEDIDDADFREWDGDSAIVIDLAAERPVRDLLRIIVKGTGPRPAMGANSVPLAGLVGGPPGSRHDGHDAVWTLSTDRESSSDETGGAA